MSSVSEPLQANPAYQVVGGPDAGSGANSTSNNSLDEVKAIPQTGALSVGLSWETSDKTDLDASAICFSLSGSVVDAAYYNQLTAAGGGVTHSGDSLKGEADGYDEILTVDLDKLNGVSVVLFYLSAYSGGTLQHCETASMEVKAVANAATGRGGGGESVIGTYMASGPETGNFTGLIMAMMYKDVNTMQWTFRRIMKPVNGRHFAACITVLRELVDTVLDPGCIGERTLSHDKIFDMSKGDCMTLPDSLRKVTLGLGWTAGKAIDLDASCILLQDVDNDGDLDPIDCVYFAQKMLPGIRSCGDNMSGDKAGDDESILVNLDEVSKNVKALAFVVTIYAYKATFASVTDSYVRLLDSTSKKELARMKLGSKSKKNAVVFAMLTRDKTNPKKWTFVTLGEEAYGSTSRELDCSLWDGTVSSFGKKKKPPSSCCTIA